MKELHHVTITFDGGPPSLSFSCDAGEGSTCRLVCMEPGCEEGCVDPVHHVWQDTGECSVVTWLENSDPAECIDGAATHATLPIRYTWHREGVDWRFANGHLRGV